MQEPVSTQTASQTEQKPVIQLNKKQLEDLSKLYVSLLKQFLTGTIAFGVKSNGNLDHYFGSQKAQSNPTKTTRINRELRTMADHLPLSSSSAAFVRYDETNIDFLRALIIGSEGTPYAHGCYLFDIFMGDYPTSPPKVNLITTGKDTVRFNPNLYANGYVCLSLLGTWSGAGCETWSAKSNITQVLVSIQSLVMSEDVYGNEPGYEAASKTAEGKLLNEGYCNIVKYANIKYAMIEQINNPPQGFERVVEIHFYLKKDAILQDVKKWVDAAPYTKGNYTGLVMSHNNSFCDMFHDSSKFAKHMSTVYEELKTALEKFKLKVDHTFNFNSLEEEKSGEPAPKDIIVKESEERKKEETEEPLIKKSNTVENYESKVEKYVEQHHEGGGGDSKVTDITEDNKVLINNE